MQLHHISETELLSLLQHEDTRDKGFRILVLQYQEPLYSHIRRLVKTHENANDVTQNTFIKVYRNIQNFKGDAKLFTWLYRIATNESLTFLRQQKRAFTPMDTATHPLAEQLTADTSIDSKDIEQLLHRAIDTLPEKQRLVFLMRYVDDLSYQSISEILDTSVGGLKASYHHAAKKIEAFIRQHAFDY